MTPRKHPRHTPAFSLSLISAALLAACGSGSDAPAMATINGVVADGALQGATVCYDLNDNGACDAGEPASAATDADGKYTLSVLASESGRHVLIANVPASAINKDTGAAIGVALTFKSPATGTPGAQAVFVSALTTAVVDIAQDSGKSVADAVAQVKASLNLAASPLADFTGANGPADAALAARALTAVLVETTKLAAVGGLSGAQTAALLKTTSSSQLDLLADTLANSSGADAAAKAAEAVAALQGALNLTAATVKAVAEQLSKPAGTADAAGPFVSLRRFAYTDANNYSYTIFTGDSSQTDGSGEYLANELRKTQSAGADVPFNRNQMYWTGSEWQTCALQWQVVSRIKPGTAATPQTSSYCAASRAESKVLWDDVSGKTLREVVAQFRAYPLADGVGAHTDAISGLPVNWGPAPDLLPADAVFPAGSKTTSRSTRFDIGGVDRIELTNKSRVRWPDGVYRQATTLVQYGGMPGDLLDASVLPGNANTVFVSDLALADQPDATLEKFKRYRAGFDFAAMKVRFYRCDLRKIDQDSINCASTGDGSLAISTQGGLRLMRVVSGYPAELTARLSQQRFWAEAGGTVFRGLRDLERTRYDQRLNGVAWAALRSALAIPAHTDAVAPASSGPFAVLRNFSFTDLNNHSLRIFDGDSSLLDGNGYFVANEVRQTVSGGALQPLARNRIYWTGTEWYACPDDGVAVILANSKAPFNSTYCKTYLDDRASSTVLTLAGRLMSDVVTDIRAYGSTDFGAAYNAWGPTLSAQPQLATTRFPAGATMEYRGNLSRATPIAVAIDAGSRVRVAPADARVPFDTWPYAASLDEFITQYPGDLVGSSLNGSTAIFVHGYNLPAAPSALYTPRIEIRVAFDASGQKARFYQNNRLVSNGFTGNYVKLLDTTYKIDTLDGVRVLSFAAMPDGFEASHGFQRLFAERVGGVWYAFKDSIPGTPQWSIRLNSAASVALRTALGLL